MSEPKVVHEFEGTGKKATRYVVYSNGSMQYESPVRGLVDYTGPPTPITLELARLAAELEKLGPLLEVWVDRGEAAEADIKRLREALLILATVGEHELLDSDADRMAEFAAEALKEKP